MSVVKERLLEFIEYLGIKKNAFEQTIGVSNGFVNNTNDRITKRSLDSIKSAYPQLNIDWLINGRGEMILDVVPDEAKHTSDIDSLIKRIDKLIELHERDAVIHEQNARNIDRLLSIILESGAVPEIKEKNIV